MPFLPLRDEGVTAHLTSYSSPEKEIVALADSVRLAVKDSLHAIKLSLANQRIVTTGEAFSGGLDVHDTRVERVVEDVVYSGLGDGCAVYVAKSQVMELLGECADAVLPRCI